MPNLKRSISVLILLSILIPLSACGGETDKVRALAKAEDDAAVAELGITDLIGNMKQSGLLSQAQVNQFKVPLETFNNLNIQAIGIAKTLATGEIPVDKQAQLLQIISLASQAIVDLNNKGTLHIKDPAKQAAFNALCVAMQAAITTVIVILNTKGKTK